MNAAPPSSWRTVTGLLAALAAAMFVMPVLAVAVRAPWSRLVEQVSSPAVLDALRLSLVASLGATAIAVAFGLPLAIWLASGRSLLRTVVRIVVLLPIVLPPVVGGVALLLAFGHNGIVGSLLDRWFGIALPFTTAGIVVAGAYLGVPFFVLTVEAGLRAFDPRWLEAASTLGAGPWRRFFRVTLPMVRPSLRAGLLLCWARALGEFCATQTFAGNLAGRTRTLPLACAMAMENEPDLAIVLALVLATVSIAVLFVLRHGWTVRQ